MRKGKMNTKPEYFYPFADVRQIPLFAALIAPVVVVFVLGGSALAYGIAIMFFLSWLWLMCPITHYVAIEKDALIVRRFGLVTIVKFDDVYGFSKTRGTRGPDHILIYQDGDTSRRTHLMEHIGRTGRLTDRLNVALTHYRAGGEASKDQLRASIQSFNSTAYFEGDDTLDAHDRRM